MLERVEQNLLIPLAALARARDTFRYPGAWKASSEIPADTLVASAVILVPSCVEVDANSSRPSSEKHHTSFTCERPVAEKQVADERAIVRVPVRITGPPSETPIRSRIRSGSVTSGANAVSAAARLGESLMHRSDLGWTRQWNEADGVATTAKASTAVTRSIRHRSGGFQASATVPDRLQIASNSCRSVLNPFICRRH